MLFTISFFVSVCEQVEMLAVVYVALKDVRKVVAHPVVKRVVVRFVRKIAR